MQHAFIGPIPWGHSGPLCHALSLLLSSFSLTSMRRWRATVAACDSSDTWWMAMWRWLAVANGTNIFQMLLVNFNDYVAISQKRHETDALASRNAFTLKSYLYCPSRLLFFEDLKPRSHYAHWIELKSVKMNSDEMGWHDSNAALRWTFIWYQTLLLQQALHVTSQRLLYRTAIVNILYLSSSSITIVSCCRCILLL